MPNIVSVIVNYQLSIQTSIVNSMEAKFVRPVSYPYDVDAGLQAVVLLQAYLFFVLHYRTAHADDDDLLALWSLDIQARLPSFV